MTEPLKDIINVDCIQDRPKKREILKNEIKRANKDRVCCADCGGPGGDIDTVLDAAQWKMIGNPPTLCANCIVRRASKLPNVIGVTCRIRLASDYPNITTPMTLPREPAIYISERNTKVPLSEALEFLTDEALARGEDSTQTVIDLCNALRGMRTFNHNTWEPAIALSPPSPAATVNTELLEAAKRALAYFDARVGECVVEDEDDDAPEARLLRKAIARAESPSPQPNPAEEKSNG